MYIKVYHATNAKDVPEGLFWALDGDDDRYWAAFANYEDSHKLVVVAFGTSGGPEINGQPIAALIATRGHIITGYLDRLSSLEVTDEADDEPIDDDDEVLFAEDDLDLFSHEEPDRSQRLAALLARLRKVSNASWLLVHDADWIEDWIEQGFRVVDPPADVPADEAVLVLAWGELPEDAYALLHARGLSWHRDTHRGFVAHGPDDDES